MKIIIVAKGTAGDLAPLLAVGSILLPVADQVVFVSHTVYQTAVEQSGMRFVPLDKEGETKSFLQDIVLLNTSGGTPAFFRKHLLPRTMREYEILCQEIQENKTVLFVRHMATIADLLISEKTGTPVVRLFTAPSQVRAFAYLEALLSIHFAADLSHVRLLVGLRPELGWPFLLRIPKINVGSWPSFFARADPEWPVQVLPIGFLNHDAWETGPVPPQICAFLEQRPRPVLVSAGSADVQPSKFFAVVGEACDLLGRSAIVVTRFHHLTAPISPLVTHCPYLPFASILEQISLMVHHGGMGTIARATEAGIPQLIMAQGGDRPDNAIRLMKLGISRYLPAREWNRAKVVEAMEYLIQSEKVSENCSNVARRIRAENKAELLEHVVQRSLAARLEDSATLSHGQRQSS